MPIKASIATFNLMSLDDRPDRSPRLDERIPILRPQLIRLDADILCLQEVCAQHERNGKSRLEALDRLLENTPYESFNRASTIDRDGNYLGHHNLVILSRYDIVEQHQYQHQWQQQRQHRFLHHIV